MTKSLVRYVVIPVVLVTIAGCSSPGKKGKSTATASSTPFLSSSKKVQQDFTQTETDLGQLESEIKVK